MQTKGAWPVGGRQLTAAAAVQTEWFGWSGGFWWTESGNSETLTSF